MKGIALFLWNHAYYDRMACDKYAAGEPTKTVANVITFEM